MNPKYFEIAKRLSVNSDHHQHKIGAVVVKRNQIIGMGFNKMRTHPKSPHPYKSCHAEFCAVKNIKPELLKDAAIYVYRENRQGSTALAKPCPSCFSLLKSLLITHIYYTINNGWALETV